MAEVRHELTLLLALAACGGGGGGGGKNNYYGLDASPQIDATADARVCTNLTTGTTDIKGYDAVDNIIVFGGPVNGDLGDGNPLSFQFEFYGGIEPTLQGTFDLTQGNQANYQTCAICVRAFSQDPQGNPLKVFFQSGGSITLTEDPLTNEHMVGTVSNLALQEVTIDSSYQSTPVANGACTTYGSFAIDHDKVPNAYACAHDTYEDGTTCDCGCAGSADIPDPDCLNGNLPVNGCAGGQICYSDNSCQTPPANDTCGTAAAITIGTPVHGTTVDAANNYNAGLEGATCDGISQAGPDVAYSVVLAANQAITVTLSGLDAGYDGSVALVGPGAAACNASPITACVAGADLGFEGGNETFQYTATTAGTYYLIVDSFYVNEAGAFTLSVSSP
jgi:hypothetical protein